jgi:hypothetical protein
VFAACSAATGLIRLNDVRMLRSALRRRQQTATGTAVSLEPGRL